MAVDPTRGITVIIQKDNQQYQFPIPINGYEKDDGMNNFTYNIQNVGEISVTGRRRLTTISFSSFFPAQSRSGDSYVDNEWLNTPWDWCKQINLWKEAGPIRLILENSPDHVNENFLIQDFKYSQDPTNGFGDIDFTLDFIQSLPMQEGQAIRSGRSVSNRQLDNRNTNRDRAKSGTNYVVQPNDSIATIAKKFYGTTDKINLILDRNASQVRDYNQFPVGTTIYIPKS